MNVDVIRQHAFWIIEAGVTCIEIDWSNSLWGGQKWSDRSIGAQELNNATVLALETCVFLFSQRTSKNS